MMRLVISSLAAKLLSVRPAAVALLVLLFIAPTTDAAPPSDRTHYGSPEEALNALKQAAAADDRETLRSLFGPEVALIASGDPAQDAADLKSFAGRLEKVANLVRDSDDRVLLHVGVEGFPFPVPIVRQDDVWYFNTEEGVDEILNRRVGENEFNAIRVCRGYVAAQYEYFALDRDADGMLEYAQRLASTPGKHGGLYWETGPSEQVSPLGPLVAAARAEGYTSPGAAAGSATQPYHGYVYKLLTRQGKEAPGGEFDYVINGNMVAGFALIAYPAEWGSSGVMTFTVNANGKVYEKNLGENTVNVAASISAYDPDDTWRLAGE